MSSHPDADAFIRAVLTNLDDATPRLVFADWLEETDESANIAWANYIRVQADLAGQPPIGGRWPELEAAAAEHALHIRATLTVPATMFSHRFRALDRLLPLRRYRVDLNDSVCPRAVAELIPASVAHENLVLPLVARRRELFVAMADPDNRDTIEKLEFILNRRVVPIAADPEVVRRSIDRTYGPMDWDFIDIRPYRVH